MKHKFPQKIISSHLGSFFRYFSTSAKDKLRINVEIEGNTQNATVHLMDWTGHSLKQETIRGNTVLQWDLSLFSPGLYIIHLKQGKHSVKEKVLIVR